MVLLHSGIHFGRVPRGLPSRHKLPVDISLGTSATMSEWCACRDMVHPAPSALASLVQPTGSAMPRLTKKVRSSTTTRFLLVLFV